MRPKWEVVLLYLLEIGSVEGSEPLEGATQKGISRSLSIPLPHVPRILKPLLSEGLVVERKEHIKGKKRRLLTYFLTERGVRRAREIQEEAMEEVVEVGGRRLKLREVRGRYPDYTGPLSPILLGIDLGREGVVEHKEVPEWYRKVRKEALERAIMEGDFYVEEWEVAPLLALLSEMGYSHAKMESGIYRIADRSGREVMVAVGERSGFRPLPPSPLQTWKEACPGLEEVAEALYGISEGDLKALRKLKEMEDEVRKCLKINNPRECALMVYIGENSIPNR
ncbi:MAG: hypothetical protein J7L88_02085 [Thermoplasmata archaeon]|nr:hypothetical protein [Thermoplasmata archaeon]